MCFEITTRAFEIAFVIKENHVTLRVRKMINQTRTRDKRDSNVLKS